MCKQAGIEQLDKQLIIKHLTKRVAKMLWSRLDILLYFSRLLGLWYEFLTDNQLLVGKDHGET